MVEPKRRRLHSKDDVVRGQATLSCCLLLLIDDTSSSGSTW
jgi:hypothetical protein